MTATPASRRHWRLIGPVLTAFALIALTIGAHWWIQPDPGDGDYLSPAAPPGGVGASGLADLIHERGVVVRRVTTARAALDAAGATSTLFVPTSQYLTLAERLDLAQLPRGTRVVLVEPDQVTLDGAAPVLLAGDRRWATAVVDPGDCPLTAAGPAATARTRYAAPAWSNGVTRCYDDSVVAVDYLGVEFVVVGSADPFRDDRLTEHDNGRLATDLLTARPEVIWLDLHTRAQAPRPSTPPAGQPEAPVLLERGSPYPDWLTPLVVLALAAFAVLALARGRRLGPVAVEPLPIRVRGAEIAVGRARLYSRAKARAEALRHLRDQATRRLAADLGLPPGGDRATVLDALSRHTGRDREALAAILDGPDPLDDDQLVSLAAQVRSLSTLPEPTTAVLENTP